MMDIYYHKIWRSVKAMRNIDYVVDGDCHIFHGQDSVMEAVRGVN